MSGPIERAYHRVTVTVPNPVTGLVAVAATLLYIGLLDGLGVLLVVLGVLTVEPVSVWVAAAGLFGGPLAVVGSVAGYLGYHSVSGFVPVWKGVEYLSLGLLLHLFVSRSGSLTRGAPLRSLSQLRALATGIALAGLGSAALFAWGYDVVGEFRFAPLVFLSGATQTLSALLGAFVVFGVLPRLVGTERWREASSALRSGLGPPPNPSTAWIRLSVLLLGVWLAVGTAVSVWFRTIAQIPTYQLRLRNLDVLLVFTDAGVFSHGGSSLQLGVGVTVLALWLLSLHRYDVFTRGRE
ncbi:hypothetical protein [Haloarcula onubensis]|uniref:Uncharacterized protein n=1 Tax=Haloarcula onubensis TaxID=2950539 RepID=A0ABU2FWJ1_9EURY|nr:hypothetical protein [Halomicroarcula sp. S3CR25-11]MDS0284526.1 hypothetical protein [Halomicroarcula sp. S3CR25-11]